MAMKQIFLPHGLRIPPDATPEQIETLRHDHQQRTAIALDQWERALRAGFVVIEKYDTADEGRAFAVFVLHQRAPSKRNHWTPRMKAAQATANLDMAFAALVKAETAYTARHRAAREEGTDEALQAERAAECAIQEAQTRVIRMARKLMKQANALLDQTL